MGTPSEYGDRLELRGSVEEVEIEITSTGSWFAGRRQKLLSPITSSPVAVDVFSDGIEEIVVRLTERDRSVEIRPIRAWRTWRRVGLEGLEIRWTGGGPRSVDR
jgi:hypothetical protein